MSQARILATCCWLSFASFACVGEHVVGSLTPVDDAGVACTPSSCASNAECTLAAGGRCLSTTQGPCAFSSCVYPSVDAGPAQDAGSAEDGGVLCAPQPCAQDVDCTASPLGQCLKTVVGPCVVARCDYPAASDAGGPKLDGG